MRNVILEVCLGGSQLGTRPAITRPGKEAWNVVRQDRKFSRLRSKCDGSPIGTFPLDRSNIASNTCEVWGFDLVEGLACGDHRIEECWTWALREYPTATVLVRQPWDMSQATDGVSPPPPYPVSVNHDG